MSKKIIKMDFNTINQKLIDNEFNSSFEFDFFYKIYFKR